jgi:hypothetical protein
MEFAGNLITDLKVWGDNLYIASDDVSLVIYNFQTTQKEELDTYLENVWKIITLIEGDHGHPDGDHPLMIITYREGGNDGLLSTPIEEVPKMAYGNNLGLISNDQYLNSNKLLDLGLGTQKRDIDGKRKFQLKFQEYDFDKKEFRRYLPR